MKICLLGATGRTGKEVLSQALERGWEVQALVRGPHRVTETSSKLKLFAGQPNVRENLRSCLQGCDAVINTLNISRTSDFPWATLRTPQDFLSTVAALLTELMPEAAVKRIVFTSAWGVGDSSPDIPGWFRWVIYNSNIGYAYQDHKRQEDLFEASHLDWTAVRPVGLINSKTKKPKRISLQNDPQPKLLVSRAQVAQFLLDCVADGAYIKEKPVISWG